jgi:N12 class adenine-specific DNA methylase
MPHKDPQKRKEYLKRYLEANRDKKKEYLKTYYVKNRDARKEWDRKYALKKDYDMDLQEYDAMLEQQGGVCAICSRPEQAKGIDRLAVDHDHVTGKVRGLLCSSCNRGIGCFKEDINLLRGAVSYLEKC